MKIRTRILLITVLLLIAALAVSTGIAIYNIKKKAKEDIESYRQTEMAKERQNLKNFVDLAYETVQANYQTTQDQKYLEKFYGERLKNMVSVIYDVVKANRQNANDPQYLQKFYGHRLCNIIEVAESILNEKNDQVEKGLITKEEALKQAKASIANIRYNNSGYLWINSNELPYPKMIVHPLLPDLNGKVLDAAEYNCALGKKQNLFQAAVEVCRKDGSGFIDYTWPKPGPDGKLIPDVKKLSYVKLYKPWNWVIGVGIYVDDAVDDAKQLSLQEIKSMRFDNGTGYFWVNDDTSPTPKMIMHAAHPDFDGKVMTDKAFNSVGPEKKNLFQEFLRICQNDGQGFVFYQWYRTKEDEADGIIQPKLSYVKYFKPWHWIIGTGIYLEDAINSAQHQAMQDIKKMRYDNGIGYFWINDMGTPYPKMIMHSTSEMLNGKELSDPSYNCVKESKENLFRAMVNVCQRDGQGFVEYQWPKPGADGKQLREEPKLSYVRLFKPWNWVIGTGVYVDHIYNNIRVEEQRIKNHVNTLINNILMATIVIIAIAVLLCVVFANSLSAPISNLISAMKSVDLQNISSTCIDLKGAEEIRELGGIFNRMLGSIHTAVVDLKETTAAKERIESELDVAREIQMSIIPKLYPAFPERPEFDVFGKLETAKAVGGDLYDFFFIDDDHFCFVIGDVSGKGIPASLFMAVTRTLIRAKTLQNTATSEIVQNINDVLCIDNEKSMFVTMLFCILNLKTGKLQYCNAGHNPAYIVRKQQDLEKMDKIHGIPVGVMEDIQYESDDITLNAGDSVVLYTDGITEAHNISNELFDDHRLVATLHDCKMYSPKATVDEIYKRVIEFAGEAEQADDITLLALNYRGNISKPS